MLAYGDFNNDLHTDFVAQTSNNNFILMYTWNSSDAIFIFWQTINTTDCPISSVFLYDLDLNGFLDVVVWGTVNNQNCVLPFIHQSNGTFVKATQILMQPTSNPFVVSFGPNNGQKTIALAAYQNGSRVLLKYEPNTLNFTLIKWSNIFLSSTDMTSIPFADPHWNSHLDLTGDCQSDTVVYNKQGNL